MSFPLLPGYTSVKHQQTHTRPYCGELALTAAFKTPRTKERAVGKLNKSTSAGSRVKVLNQMRTKMWEEQEQQSSNQRTKWTKWCHTVAERETALMRLCWTNFSVKPRTRRLFFLTIIWALMVETDPPECQTLPGESPAALTAAHFADLRRRSQSQPGEEDGNEPERRQQTYETSRGTPGVLITASTFDSSQPAHKWKTHLAVLMCEVVFLRYLQEEKQLNVWIKREEKMKTSLLFLISSDSLLLLFIWSLSD